MLRGIPREDNAALLFFSERSNARQGASAQESGLINPDHLTPDLVLKLGILQQGFNGLGVREPGLRPKDPARRFRRRRESKNFPSR